MEPGEFIVVPKGVEHKPFTDGECEILPFERAGAVSTGDATEREPTRERLERI